MLLNHGVTMSHRCDLIMEKSLMKCKDASGEVFPTEVGDSVWHHFKRS